MFWKKKRLYMDYASATPLHREVVRALQKALSVYGNPSSPHEEGRLAQSLLEDARIRIARILRVKPASLTFSGSGTESNNLAIRGVIGALLERGAKPETLHIITSAFEHPSILEPLKVLEARGVMVSYLAPTPEGLIEPEAVRRAVRSETVLVSIAAAQGEIGVIQNIRGIHQVLSAYKDARKQTAQHFFPEAAFPIFHSDASQSLFEDFSPEKLKVDMATYDAQKLMGPKGIGLLYKHSSVAIAPFLRGGSQERRLRPGTENVLGAVGMARAFEVSFKNRPKWQKRVRAVRNYFISLLETEVPHARLNGSVVSRLPNNINISIPNADGDYVSVLMDTEGIAVSPRSACIARGEASRAVSALGVDVSYVKGTVRFSFGPDVTRADARRAVAALKKAAALSTGR